MTERKNKYGNHKTRVFNLDFDSKAEGNRYLELRNWETRGLITELKIQPKFNLWSVGFDTREEEDYGEMEAVDWVATVRANWRVSRMGIYTADFSYINHLYKFVVEDVKSVATAKIPDYRMRVRLMKSIYNIDVVEIM